MSKCASTLEKYLVTAIPALILISTGLAFLIIHNLPLNQERTPKYQQNDNKIIRDSHSKSSKVCDSKACVVTASRILKHIDVTSNPCDNFVRFACGNFRKTARVPDEFYGVSNYDLANYQLELRLRDILREPIQDEEPKFSKLSKHYYEVCMDKNAVQADDLDTIKAILKDLGGWPVLEGSEWASENFDWKNVTIKSKKLGLPFEFFMNIKVENVEDSQDRKILWLRPPSKPLLFSQLVAGTINATAYFDFVLNVVETFGIERDSAIEDMNKFMEFRLALANIFVQGSKIDGGFITHPIRKMQGFFPSVRWFEFINTLLYPDSSISLDDLVKVHTPSYFKFLENLLKKTPKRVQANYIFIEIVSWAIRYLSENINLHSVKLESSFTGRKELTYRWRTCVNEIMKNGLQIAATALYAKDYHNRDSRNEIAKIAEHIRQETKDTLRNSNWIDEKSKLLGSKIIENQKLYIAYSENLLNVTKVDEFYSDLDFNRSNNLLLSTLEMNLFVARINYKKLVETERIKYEWTAFEPLLESFIRNDPNKKITYLTAGILIPGVFFDNNSPESIKFGSIGTILAGSFTYPYFGHIFNKNVISHLINETYWKQVNCFFSKWKPYQNRTKTETLLSQIVDVIGVNQAYISYKNSTKHDEHARLENNFLPGLNFTQNQLFWIAYGNLWCSVLKPQYEKTFDFHITTHLPHELKVLDSLKNSEYFSRDFNCSIGTNMNPKDKCTFF